MPPVLLNRPTNARRAKHNRIVCLLDDQTAIALKQSSVASAVVQTWGEFNYGLSVTFNQAHEIRSPGALRVLAARAIEKVLDAKPIPLSLEHHRAADVTLPWGRSAVHRRHREVARRWSGQQLGKQGR